MEFFSRTDTRTYFNSISTSLQNEVVQMTDENITTCDFSEWTNYLYSKYEIVPITIFEDSITQSISEIKVKRHNQFGRMSPYEPEYFMIDGCRIVYKIPYDGDSDLLLLRPSSVILTRFDIYNHNSPRSDNTGDFELEFEFTKKELQDKGDEMQSFVKAQFESKFRHYRTMIGNVNNEVASFNSQLTDFAKKCLEERKEKASSFAMISQMLEIPLTKSKNAPAVTPVPLKRTARTPAITPSKKPLPKEYGITDSNYENINNIIYTYSTAMEKTARTYYTHTEEELRDHLLATLSTHYYNATGETFRKNGKTDILIEAENKAAFIGECKIWHGEKEFTKALQQILNYSTWRDVKISIIIFNKKNKSFQGVITQIDDWAKKNMQSHTKVNQNMWDCQYYRADMNINIRLNILAFDLYVDETQFKDSRN